MQFHEGSGGSLAHCGEGLLSVRSQYSSDATLVLVGFPGAGKKTLGIIASVALRRRFIDFAAYFQQEVHVSPQNYIAQYGSARYREVELRLCRDLLSKHSCGCVIVGIGWVASNELQTQLKDFSRQHPIIYIRRDEKALQERISTSPETLQRLLRVGHPFFKSCSNFDFYNLTEDSTGGTATPQPTYLKLKDTETTFVRYLQRIFGVPDRPRYSAEPFSPSHTYSLQLPLSWLEKPGQNYEELDNGADVISLVIDMTELYGDNLAESIPKCVAILKRHSRAPVIVDVRAPEPLDMAAYHNLLALVARLGPEALTCSLACDDKYVRQLIASTGHVKIIATYHQSSPLNAREISPKFTSMCDRAHKLGCAAMRITGESDWPEDNLGCVSFLQTLTTESSIPIVAYHIGQPGRPSACFNPTLSPVVLESMRPAGITLREAQLALSGCFLSEKKKFTLIGKDLTHTLSPEMHHAAYAACGLCHTYDITESTSLLDIDALLSKPEYGGVAVSLPYKTEVLRFLDEISPDARDINAVNTVVIETRHQPGSSPRRLRKGYNTDYIGIRHCIYKHLSPANAIRHGTTALIIGAGGMAHAAVYACYQLGVRHICVYNRTSSNAQKLVDHFAEWAASRPSHPLHFTLLDSTDAQWPTHLRPPTIIVSCIPGQRSHVERPASLQLPDQWLRSKTGGVFVEVAYGPLQTSLLKLMQQYKPKGWVVVDGFCVLLEQGIAQYELFTNRPAPIYIMKRAIQQAIEKKNHGSSIS